MSKLTKEDVFDLILDRPRKFSADDVDYRPAPAGSALRCSACINLYRRATDNFSVCQLMRSDETDDEGVQPNFTCDWWSLDNQVFPRQPEEKLPEVEEEETA